MSDHARRVLALDEALEAVAGRASSALGRERVLALEPATDPDRIGEELATVDETRAFLTARHDWVPPALPDARAALRALAPEGSVLAPMELRRLGDLLRSGRLLRHIVAEERETHPRLWRVAGELLSDRERESAVDRIVDEGGAVLDSASKELRRIRTQTKRGHSRIVRALERYLGGLSERHRVPDASVSIRNGRYVIPVRREGKGEVGGIVHDESATGATLFIEPRLAIEMMNDLLELEREEAREIHRILTAETERLRPRRYELGASQDALARFDALYARARTQTAWNATVPELAVPDAGALRIVGGRHPLLLAGPGEQEVVPFDLELDSGERAMVVSGPNTGGKTVFLKALGLITLLARCGVVPPLGPGSRLPVFRRVYVDIGDEQSIAASLSTFSAHLANLREIVEQADAESLVLIDEMGTGTDPAEGAALATAVIETLVQRRATAVVTSHLGALKRLDTEGSGIVNASLEFDSERMRPTYVLVKGRPGRSYGLRIARQLGFPSEVLDRADALVSDQEGRLDDLLEKLERKEREVRELSESLAGRESHARRVGEDLARRERELAAREKSAERRAMEDARRMLLDARAEVEDAIRQVRESSPAERDEAERAARRQVEQAVSRHEPEPETPRAPAEPLTVGDRVRIASTGTTGEVVELRDDRVVVLGSGVRLTVSASDLSRVAEEARKARPAAVHAGGWEPSEVRGAGEADLRGLRVDEVQLELGRAIDAAVLQDLDEIRIIHGKGTGAVRQRVQELLQREPRVGRYRLGGPGEGGAGVTVATLR